MDLNGLAALVSGGATGLGAQTARHFAAKGALVSVFDTDDENGARIAREIGGAYFRAELTDDAAIAAAVIEAERRHGVARVLANCATVAMSMPVVGPDGSPHPLADYRHAIEGNLVGTFNVLSKFASRLVHVDTIGEERGVIVNTGSAAGTDGQIGQAAHAAAKAGVIGMTLPLARELAEHRIRVMTISPGLFATPGIAALPNEILTAIEAKIPHPSRAGSLNEFARLVVEIIENPMLNGTTVRLDGAIRLEPR